MPTDAKFGCADYRGRLSRPIKASPPTGYSCLGTLWEAEAVSTRGDRGCMEGRAPAGPASRCRLNGQAMLLWPDVWTELTMKSRSQGTPVAPVFQDGAGDAFLGSKRGLGRERWERAGAATQELRRYPPLRLPGWLFHTQPHLPSFSGHMGDIWEHHVLPENLSSASRLPCLQG